VLGGCGGGGGGGGGGGEADALFRLTLVRPSCCRELDVNKV